MLEPIAHNIRRYLICITDQFTNFAATIILFFLFFLIITPIGFILKIIGVDIIGLTIDPEKTSWKTSNLNLSKYEDQF